MKLGEAWGLGFIRVLWQSHPVSVRLDHPKSFRQPSQTLFFRRIHGELRD